MLSIVNVQSQEQSIGEKQCKIRRVSKGNIIETVRKRGRKGEREGSDSVWLQEREDKKNVWKKPQKTVWAVRVTERQKRGH